MSSTDGSSSEVWGTGRNDFGQLGDGTVAHRTTPTKASWVSDVPDALPQLVKDLSLSMLQVFRDASQASAGEW